MVADVSQTYFHFKVNHEEIKKIQNSAYIENSMALLEAEPQAPWVQRVLYSLLNMCFAMVLVSMKLG